MNTSLAFTDITSHGNKAAQTEKILALVKAFPYRTARELARKINADIISHDNLHKRLPELEDLGLVAKSYTRRCTISNKRAAVWVALSQPITTEEVGQCVSQ